MKNIMKCSTSLCVLMLISCQSIRLSDFVPGRPNSKLLPPLELKIDQSSLTSVFFDLGGVHSSNYTDVSNIAPGFDVVTTSGHAYNAVDPRPQDFTMMIQKEFENGIVSTVGEKKGTISFKVERALYPRFNVSNFFLGLISGFSLTLVNAIGVPIIIETCELELTAEIKNNKGDIIEKYRTTSIGSSNVGYYYYTVSGAKRKAALNAIKDSLAQIKTKIAGDYDNIIRSL